MLRRCNAEKAVRAEGAESPRSSARRDLHLLRCWRWLPRKTRRASRAVILFHFEVAPKMNQEQRDLTLEQLLQEKVFSYDTEKYDFLSIMHKIFGVDDLSRLHELVPEASQPNFLDFQNDQGTWFHKTYYNSPFLPELLELYRRFVTEEIAPQFKSESIVYQTRPTFRFLPSLHIFSLLIRYNLRVHLPNNLAVGQKHRDGDYHHPYGEVNYCKALFVIQV